MNVRPFTSIQSSYSIPDYPSDWRQQALLPNHAQNLGKTIFHRKQNTLEGDLIFPQEQ